MLLRFTGIHGELSIETDHVAAIEQYDDVQGSANVVTHAAIYLVNGIILRVQDDYNSVVRRVANPLSA